MEIDFVFRIGAIGILVTVIVIVFCCFVLKLDDNTPPFEG